MSSVSSAVLALSVCLAPLACVSSVEPDVDVAASPGEDREYAKALERATQQRVVLKDFETRYRVTATYLSPEFRSAFVKRREKVYQQSLVQFEEASTKAGFIVSLHTPDEDRTDLTNPQHWTVLLTTPTGTQKPVLIRKYTDKESLRAFLPAVDDWTTDYLVVFDAPSVDTASAALVEKTPLSLTFANADAQVKLSW